MTDTHQAAPEPVGDADLFIDFANTLELTGGVASDHVAEADLLRSWLRSRDLAGARCGLMNVERAIPAFRDLRALLLAITDRVAGGRDLTAKQLAELNAVMREGRHYHQLRRSGNGTEFTVGQVGDELDQARAAIAGSLAHYLADHDADRLRVCANDACRWRFVDRSPAGRRRWCDMRVCGNRAKVARHRARARTADQGGATRT